MGTLVEENIKTVVKVAMTRTAKWIVQEKTEEVFSVGYHKQKNGRKTPVKNMMEAASVAKVEQDLLDIILVYNVNKFARPTPCMDALTPK